METTVSYHPGESLRDAVTRWRDELDAQRKVDPALLSDKSVVDILTMFLAHTEDRREDLNE